MAVLKIVLDAINQTGLTVTAKVRDDAGAQVGSNVSTTEPSAGFYTGNFVTVAADGEYSVEFVDASGSLLGEGPLYIRDNAEVTQENLADFVWSKTLPS